jgi:dCMP deaminase
MNSTNWDHRFLDLAKLVASWSKDPSTQVGAVIVDDKNRIVSLGFNGFPKNITDDNRLDNRQMKYNIVVHAECNAIMFANKTLENCTIYTHPFQPCSKCAGMIIQSGIKRVVTLPLSIEHSSRWSEDFDIAKNLLLESNTELTYITQHGRE